MDIIRRPTTTWNRVSVYLMESQAHKGLYKIGLSRWPSLRQNAVAFRGKSAKMRLLLTLRFTAILPNGDLSKGEDWREVLKKYALEDFGPAFLATQDKAKKMETFFKKKFAHQCVHDTEWFLLAPNDVNYIKRHFEARSKSENDLFTKTELNICYPPTL